MHTAVILIYRCGAAKRQSVGRLSNVELSHSSTLLYGAVAQERRTVAMERIAFLAGALCRLRCAEARCADVVRRPVVLKARCGQRDPVLRVMATERPLEERGCVRVWSAHASGNPNDGCRGAEHAHAADR